MTRISMRTGWKVLIFPRKTNDLSRDLCHDYLLYADAARPRPVPTYSESTRHVISSDVDFESSVSWFWSIEMISFDFTDSRDRREDQDARRWNNWIWIKRHNDDRARERPDRHEIIRKSRFSDESRWIMIWELVNAHYEIILLYRETDFSLFLDRQ
jgi:hypothetical protein